MTAAVSFESVTYGYPDALKPVFSDVSLEVPEGAFVLVTGATGAGKSTLLRAMNGLVPHFTGGSFKGSVHVGGVDTKEVAPRDLSHVVAFVPQDPGASFVVDRVEDELAYAMENLGFDATRMRRRIEETLDLLDLSHLRDRSVRTISGGERQRVAIAAALSPGSRLLLLDEPTSQLDPQGAENILAALQRMVHDLGITVLIAEHRLERVAGFVDLAIGIDNCAVTLDKPDVILGRLPMGPPVAHLGRMLGWTPLPLTVRDARRQVQTETPRLAKRESRLPRTAGDRLLVSKSLRAAYGNNVVLHGIDFDLSVGEVLVLIGRNGAGKTTLLRCLAGLHPPVSGQVSYEGRAVRTGADVALCPQRPEAVLFRDTVRDEIATTLRWNGHSGSPGPLVEAFGLGPGFLEVHPRDLSSGQRQLVAIAAVAATGARVLLLDEPSRGLDSDSKSRLVSFLRSYVEDGRAVVVATHDVELAALIATRVVMLAGGEIAADGSPQDVLGDSPVFAPQTARVFGPEWLTPDEVAQAVMR